MQAVVVQDRILGPDHLDMAKFYCYAGKVFFKNINIVYTAKHENVTDNP